MLSIIVRSLTGASARPKNQIPLILMKFAQYVLTTKLGGFLEFQMLSITVRPPSEPPRGFTCYILLFINYYYFLLAIPIGDTLWDSASSFIFFIFFIFSFFFFFFFLFFMPRSCPGHISGTVTRRDSRFSVLLGPAV